jgi:hypothetical protein
MASARGAWRPLFSGPVLLARVLALLLGLLVLLPGVRLLVPLQVVLRVLVLRPQWLILLVPLQVVVEVLLLQEQLTQEVVEEVL